MSDIAIRVENLGKQYRIGGKQERYKTLRDTLTDALVSPFRRAGKLLRGQASGAAELDETIWALKDVSFEVRPGEVVGVIGRNGAGKTTLLKILSRITEPTTGRAEIHGRVGSLLEVGTGFHPELTGRENVFLNGAILGMTRDEIDRKFDEMVAFAEIEKFIDTPVKHYSSGMYVRLAFAVAAHLEPEILLVDEVLAVGDMEFQKKCLGKMDEIATGGRTVLFVSHNMGAIQNLCGRCILLDSGHLQQSGLTQDVIAQYIDQQSLKDNKNELLNKSKYVDRIELFNADGRPSERFLVGQPIAVQVTLRNTRALASPVLSVFVCDHIGDRLFVLGTHYQSTISIPQSSGKTTLLAETEDLNLLPGFYTLDIGVGAGGDVVEYLRGISGFTIEPADVFGTGRLPTAKQGFLAQKVTWRILE